MICSGYYYMHSICTRCATRRIRAFLQNWRLQQLSGNHIQPLLVGTPALLVFRTLFHAVSVSRDGVLAMPAMYAVTVAEAVHNHAPTPEVHAHLHKSWCLALHLKDVIECQANLRTTEAAKQRVKAAFQAGSARLGRDAPKLFDEEIKCGSARMHDTAVRVRDLVKALSGIEKEGRALADAWGELMRVCRTRKRCRVSDVRAKADDVVKDLDAKFARRLFLFGLAHGIVDIVDYIKTMCERAGILEIVRGVAMEDVTCGPEPPAWLTALHKLQEMVLCIEVACMRGRRMQAMAAAMGATVRPQHTWEHATDGIVARVADIHDDTRAGTADMRGGASGGADHAAADAAADAAGDAAADALETREFGAAEELVRAEEERLARLHARMQSQSEASKRRRAKKAFKASREREERVRAEQERAEAARAHVERLQAERARVQAEARAARERHEAELERRAAELERRAAEPSHDCRAVEVSRMASLELAFVASSIASDEDDECIVCMERGRGVRNQPCGHAVMCVPCAASVLTARKGCPLCRAEFTGFALLV